MEEKYQQKNGDILQIVEKSIKRDYCICISLKYGNKFEAKKYHIINGCVVNPEIENREFIGKKYPQKCGDILLVVEKTTLKGKDGSFLFRCRFEKYPFEIFISDKRKIKEGTIVNPQTEQVEFINKIWPQNCEDSLRIIEQVAPRKWRCQFIKYPYEVISEKKHILNKEVNNPRIEQEEFIGKEFKQNCGDILKILEKSSKKENSSNSFLFRCKFLKYNSNIYASKANILRGAVDNPSLPWKSKEKLENYLKHNFGNKKPSLQEVAKSLNLAICTIGRVINEFNLRTYISYYENYGENSLREFISQFIEVFPEEYYISDKEGKYYGIDIYIPSKKIGFEFNGTYWHSELFKNSQYHQKKSLVAREQGIQLFHIWEYEWNDPIKRPVMESLIKSKLGIFKYKIGASKCKVVDLTYKKYSDFCNSNHIQGEAGAKVKLGLIYKDKLIQTISFSIPRFTDKYEWEIIRECSKSDYIVLGGKEKLWSYFLKNYKPNSVISYCDFSKFTGNSYLKLGFEKVRLNKPGFVWYDEKSRSVYWRNPYKNEEFKRKYIRVFDAGQLVFAWQSFK